MGRLIDADALSNAFDDEGADICIDCGESSEWGFSYELLHDLIANAPTVDAVPVVHGKWKLLHIGHGHLWECNVCNKKEIRASDYCPNCGAKMDGERKSE